MPAVRAVRAFHHDSRRRRFVQLRDLQDLAGVAFPLPFQALGQTQDDHVEEAADQQPEAGRGRVAEAGVRIQERHLAACPGHITVMAILKIGRYIATTMEPTRPPMITITKGSIRLEIASTALLTSSS